MSYSLPQKQSLTQQQTSDYVKEKIVPPRVDTCSQYRNKLKAGHSFGQPYLGLNRELGECGSTEHVIQYWSSKNRQTTQQGSKICKDDELVKHMSNLPSFLQQVEKEKSVQEKALNFGVLDWKRLEKWKYNERMPAKVHRKIPSSYSNTSLFMASGPPKISSRLRKQPTSQSSHPVSSSPGKQLSSHGTHFDSSPLRKQFPSHSSHLNISETERKTGGFGQPEGMGMYLKDFQPRSISLEGQQGNLNQKAKPCGRDYSEININYGERNDSIKRTVLEKEDLALYQVKIGSSVSSPKTVDLQGGKSKMRLKNEVNLTPQHCTVEPQNIVLLVPKHLPMKSCSETSQFTESRTLFDGQLPESNWTRYSDGFSHQDLHSREFAADIPHSCPLSTSAIVNTKSALEPPNMVNAEAMDSEFWTSAGPDDVIIPKKCEAKQSLSVDASHRMNIDTEQKAGKGRHPSPNRRFSFSLGKMTRSFSFKESSAVPQLSSTYTAPNSGPVGSEFSSSMENCHKDKETASSRGRGRSSPLRRLLDPLLKYKGAHSAELVQLPNEDPNVMLPKPINTDGSIQDRKHMASTFQALLQLQVKNGLPFFKLAAANSTNVLAAAIKKLPSSGKGDHSLIYTFYSVHEIKKKSISWINQGPKGKCCGLGYNIVGQMKISSSNLPQLDSKDSSQCLVRECVLYGVDLSQVDKQRTEFLPNREIAAIVIKNPCEKLKDEDLSNESRPFKATEFARCVLGNNNSYSSVVILPVGIHGLPNKGAPSPLIDRWKSGGSCDCGGWDAGCKLQILTNQESHSRITGQYMLSSAADRLDFFFQGGEQGSKPIFSLEATSDGLYSVQFNASISLLEAFSICVAIITNRKLSEILDVNSLSKAGHLLDGSMAMDKIKSPTKLQVHVNSLSKPGHLSDGSMAMDKIKSPTKLQVPVKYVSCPPSSPVGRI